MKNLINILPLLSTPYNYGNRGGVQLRSSSSDLNTIK